MLDNFFIVIFVILILQGVLITIFSIHIFFPKNEKKYKTHTSKIYDDYYKEPKKLVDSEVLAELVKRKNFYVTP